MEHRLVEDRSKPPHTLLDPRWRDAGEAKAQFVRPGAVGIEVVTGHERDAGDSGRLREAVGVLRTEGGEMGVEAAGEEELGDDELGETGGGDVAAKFDESQLLDDRLV